MKCTWLTFRPYKLAFGLPSVRRQDLWSVMGLLARWFRFQPSEIDALSIPDLMDWFNEAKQQIAQMNKE